MNTPRSNIAIPAFANHAQALRWYASKLASLESEYNDLAAQNEALNKRCLALAKALENRGATIFIKGRV